MTPHIVEFAPRLMPLQVDEGGGAVLANLVTELGLSVHTGCRPPPSPTVPTPGCWR
jgi:nitrite reductase (NADH) large subunit